MVPTNNLSGEAGLRQAAQALIYEIRNLKRWPADAPANSESCWADVSQRWLPRLNGVLDALESIPPAAPVERKPNAPPPAPTDCLSLAELQALYGCLELVAAWGVAPLAGPGVRSTAQRGWPVAWLTRGSWRRISTRCCTERTQAVSIEHCAKRCAGTWGRCQIPHIRLQ